MERQDISLTISVPEVARADIMLTPSRIYYRLATEDTLEEGDLPGLEDRHDAFLKQMTEAIDSQEDDRGIEDSDLRLLLVTPTRRYTSADLSERALQRLTALLAELDDVFGFLRGFAPGRS